MVNQIKNLSDNAAIRSFANRCAVLRMTSKVKYSKQQTIGETFLLANNFCHSEQGHKRSVPRREESIRWTAFMLLEKE